MKKFLEEKKRQMKFKMAGQGHKLNEEKRNDESCSKNDNPAPEKRIDTKENQEKRSAILAAALQRSLATNTKVELHKKTFHKRIMEGTDATIASSAEEFSSGDAAMENTSATDPEVQTKEDHTTSGVFFRCPAIDDEVLTQDQWRLKIQQHINDMKGSDKILAAILAIKSFNPLSQVDQCIVLITRYLRNLLEYPDNEKYKSIRMGNPKFSETVLSIEGALDFLKAVGFAEETGENDESYLVFKPEVSSDLELVIQSLTDISGFNLELDRDFQAFHIDDVLTLGNVVLPDDFFEFTIADAKIIQLQRSIQAEKNSVLMTKKMREMEKARNSRRKAIYTRIRVRLPNGILIQGTFSVKEPFRNLHTFIGEHVELDSEYVLMSPPSHIYELPDEEKTFEELDLHPAVQLMLKTSSENIALKTVEQ